MASTASMALVETNQWICFLPWNINAATAIVKKLWACNHMNFGN